MSLPGLSAPNSPLPVTPQTIRYATGNPSRPSNFTPTSTRDRKPFTPPASSLVTSDLANTIRTLLSNARAVRSPLVGRWRRAYLYLRNRPNILPANAGRSVPQVPEIFPIIASKVGYKIDRRFTNTVSAAPYPGTSYFALISQLASDLSVVLESTWDANTEENEVTKALWDSEIYGTGILKTGWDLSLAQGLGDARITRVDPFNFYPDPNARSLEDANFFIEARRMSIQEMDRRWPGSAARLAGQSWLEDFDESPNQLAPTSSIPKANPGLIPVTGGGTNLFIPSRFSGGRRAGTSYDTTQDPGVTVLEAWLREHENVKDSDSPYGWTQKDTWRCVVIAGNHVLMDCPARELWAHGQHPYSRIVPHDIGEFWGFSTVELLIPTQASINRLLSALVTSVELTGNPVFIDSANSGIDRAQITNRAGQRLTMSGSGNGRADWLVPPAMTPQASELIRYFLSRMEAVSGLSAVTKGNAPSGRQQQAVVDAMQEAAFVRVRMELRQLEFALRDAGTKKAALIVENYTVPRTLSIIGPDGKESAMQLSARHFYVPGDDGEAPLQYTLKIDAGASQATSQKQRKDEAVMLFSLGAVDQMYVLEVFDVPNRAEIFKRIQYQMAAGTFQPPGARQRAQRTQ